MEGVVGDDAAHFDVAAGDGDGFAGVQGQGDDVALCGQGSALPVGGAVPVAAVGVDEDFGGGDDVKVAVERDGAEGVTAEVMQVRGVEAQGVNAGNQRVEDDGDLATLLAGGHALHGDGGAAGTGEREMISDEVVLV